MEPTFKTRRQFLKTGVLGGALGWTVPSFLARTFNSLATEAANKTQPSTGKDSPILVVLQLAGGNDGLNTIVPFNNDLYYKARPSIAIPQGKVLKLNDEFGLHPAMSGFKELYDAGQMGIIHGVGYPNPNRSHFRSTEIWQTASDSNKYERHGWLGRYFDNACKGADPTVGINIGKQMPQAFASGKPVGISLENPEKYRISNSGSRGEGEMEGKDSMFEKMNEMDENGDELNSGSSISSLSGETPPESRSLDYLERVALDAQISSELILKISRSSKNEVTYPPSQLANSLKLVARLIGGGISTRVFYVSHGGYDTHTNQALSHERLLKDLAGAVNAFMSEIKLQKNGDRVLLMTFSEFGRRVAQNANKGTDHGAAAPLFLFGNKVKAGINGKFPSLVTKNLHNGDLKFNVDFRSVYAGILEQWLSAKSDPILNGKFEPYQIVG
ncbi:MAG: DUF1501 domain-containing protein [Verrucomicrobiota bacterium]|nr:DUF1501 domain-containing protein [Verrucomicrobiota bacterium]